MTFNPARSQGGRIGLAALLVAMAVEALAVVGAARVPVGPRTAVLGLFALLMIPVIARLAYWVWGYYRLRYEVTRDGLVIRWAAVRQVIPMGDITRITSGRPYRGKVEGVSWPGYQVGHGVIEDDGRLITTLIYATEPHAGQLIIFTSSGVAYAISPDDVPAFVEEFKVRRRLGPVQRLAQETVQAPLMRREIWSDSQTLRLLAVAVAVNAILFAWTAWRHPGLPQELALQFRFDPELDVAVPGPLRPRETVWALPGMGLGALAVNAGMAFLVHPRARLAAALLAAGAVILQLVIGAVLLRVG